MTTLAKAPSVPFPPRRPARPSSIPASGRIATPFKYRLLPEQGVVVPVRHGHPLKVRVNDPSTLPPPAIGTTAANHLASHIIGPSGLAQPVPIAAQDAISAGKTRLNGMPTRIGPLRFKRGTCITKARIRKLHRQPTRQRARASSAVTQRAAHIPIPTDFGSSITTAGAGDPTSDLTRHKTCGYTTSSII
jgi:hypothetical protein